MLFVSKIRDLRLVRRPSDRIMDDQRNPIILKGERVEFSNFRFHTSDEDIINWLLNHPEYGSTFTSDKMKDRPTKGFTPAVRTDNDAIRAARALIKEYDENAVAPEERFDQVVKQNIKAKKKIELPPMVKGMIATVQAASFQEKAQKVSKPTTTIIPDPNELTKEEVSSMIKKEITSAMAQIVDLIKANQPQSAPAKKRTFHCPECGEEFPSGIAVGDHKKTAHAKPITTPEVAT